MKSRKLVLVFAVIMSFVLIAVGCSGGSSTTQTKKIEPGSMTLPEPFERYPESAMQNRNYYFAGELEDAPDPNGDYVIFFYDVSKDIQDVFDFYVDLLDEDEASIEDNRAYIVVGNDRINLHGRRTTSFTEIKVYVHVDDYIAANAE